MLHDLKVHHVATDGIVCQMPKGSGFGRLTKAGCGDDALAEALLQHYATRDTISATTRRRRDANGYVEVTVALGDICSDARVMGPSSALLDTLYRKNTLVNLGSVVNARVAKRTAKGAILALPSGIKAVAAEKVSEDTESLAVRVWDFNVAANSAAVTSTDPVKRAPETPAAAMDVLAGHAVGDAVNAVPRLVQDEMIVCEVFAADDKKRDGTSLLAFMPIEKGTAKKVRLGEPIEAYSRFVPSKPLYALLPFVLLTQDPSTGIPAIRRPTAFQAPKAGGVSAAFPWRVTDGDDEDGDDDAAETGGRTRRRKMEEAIDQFERQVDRLPSSPEDFQKALLATPNSSFLWTHYMAFHTNLEQYEAARQVAEKALSTIGVREATELLNVWVAYMNLENMHGTAESLTAIFRRAVQHNDDPLIVHEKLADIFAATRKHQQLWLLCRSMTTKHRNVPRVWERLGKVQIDQDRRDQLKRTLRDMNGALKKDEQATVIAHLALHEYRTGHVDHGRVMFENLLQKMPKKSDVWSQFIDQELSLLARKSNETSAATIRALFERVISVTLPPKAMQMFLTRFLTFEQGHGTPADVEKVKTAARSYVEGRIAQAPTSA